MEWARWLASDPAWIAVCSSLGLVCLALMAPALRWRRGFARRYERTKLVEDLIGSQYDHRPFSRGRGKQIYDAFAPKLALGRREESRADRLVGRVEQLAALDTNEIERLIEITRQWSATAGVFASAAQAKGLSLTPFLKLLHQAVIRECVLLWPAAAYGWAQGRWSPEEKENLLWGLTLLELAVRYNRLAPVQRKAVYITATVGNRPFVVGPVVEAEPETGFHRVRLLGFDLLFPTSRFILRRHSLGHANYHHTAGLMIQVAARCVVPELPAPARRSALDRPAASQSVFISHAMNHDGVGDSAAAHQLADILAAAGIRCWIAPDDLLKDVAYDEEIRRAIDRAPAVVLVFSAAADKREGVQRELRMASKRGLPLFVVRIDATRPETLEYFAEHGTIVDWLHGDRGSLNAVVDGLRTRLAEGSEGPSASPSPACQD